MTDPIAKALSLFGNPYTANAGNIKYQRPAKFLWGVIVGVMLGYFLCG